MYTYIYIYIYVYIWNVIYLLIDMAVERLNKILKYLHLHYFLF